MNREHFCLKRTLVLSFLLAEKKKFSAKRLFLAMEILFGVWFECPPAPPVPHQKTPGSDDGRAHFPNSPERLETGAEFEVGPCVSRG